jgi:hypothetical protein
MATTYTLISSVTVGAGGAATMSFTSIPATYTDLVVFCSGRAANSFTSAGLLLKFNGSSSSYTTKVIEANGSTAVSYSDTAIYGVVPANSATASTFGNTFYYIPNYAGSNNKSVSIDSVGENNSSTAYMILNAALWSNSAAITSIELSTNAGNFMQYSTAYLYGISNA